MRSFYLCSFGGDLFLMSLVPPCGIHPKEPIHGCAVEIGRVACEFFQMAVFEFTHNVSDILNNAFSDMKIQNSHI